METFNVIQTNLDLERLSSDCRRINTKVLKNFSEDNIPSNKKYNEVLNESLSLAPQSSRLHDLYNVFLFPYDGIHELYATVSREFKTCNSSTDPYYVHAWLNYQHKGETIPWHYHWHGLSGLEQTYVATFYVNAEPSVTQFEDTAGNRVEQSNKNNTFVIYEDQGNQHMVSEWQEDKPRISISMDFVPMKYIQGMPYVLNTWIPVL